MLKEKLLFEGFLGPKFHEFDFFSSCFYNKKKAFPTSLFQCSSTGCSHQISRKNSRKSHRKPPRVVDLYDLRGGRGPGGTPFQASWILFLVARLWKKYLAISMGKKDGEMLQNWGSTVTSHPFIILWRLYLYVCFEASSN